jgi:transaldolase
MTSVSSLRVQVFADGADLSTIAERNRNPLIRGFTTNPTLMRQAGVRDYSAFARQLVQAVPDKPISLEVFSDDFEEMERQGIEIASWGDNINVKIPVMNTRGEFSGRVIRRLSRERVFINVTAVMTLDQVDSILDCLEGSGRVFVSIFAGRIADTGRDPVPVMAAAAKRLDQRPTTELIWASPRELLNVFQADAAGCHIITVADDILKKLSLVGRDLHDYSRETVQMFRSDALAAGYEIEVRAPRRLSAAGTGIRAAGMPSTT